MKILIINDMIQINNELRDRAYQCACEHGFHDKEYSDAHWLMLIVSEMAEAVDADRKGKKANIDAFERLYSGSDSKFGYEKLIKGSVGEELSDIVIRCLDYAGLKKINVEGRIILSYTVTKNKSFIENMYAIVKDIVNYKYSQEELINYAFRQVLRVAEFYNIDLLWHIEQKMKYNESRPMLNGKLY